MKSQYVVEQLIGKTDAVDYVSELSLHFYAVPQFEGNDVGVDFESGIVTVWDKETGTKALKTFAIKATLEPLDS